MEINWLIMFDRIPNLTTVEKKLFQKHHDKLLKFQNQLFYEILRLLKKSIIKVIIQLIHTKILVGWL